MHRFRWPTNQDDWLRSTARLGSIQIPLLPIYRESELAFCLAQTKASHFVTPGTWRDTDYAALASRVSEGLDLEVHHFDPALPEDRDAALPAPPLLGAAVYPTGPAVATRPGPCESVTL